MLTREEAIAKARTGWWNKATDKEIAKFQLGEECLCCPFDVFYRAVEKWLGRPVWTHEFAHPIQLILEHEGKIPKATMQDVLNKMPADKTIIVVTK